ncbi:MFS transporter [Anatilimnocola floriformis]|uniref:MFS transporter n=1 Tax=Anatilimnocola floriformis TaxID=2948575 RepID=UPI0020C32456|nr:MFS transporter [Anatilimnocola floriformis]
MSVSKASEPLGSGRLSSVQWLICIIAAIGFAFDIYELLMLPLILRPALLELTGAQPGSDTFKFWFAMLFYLPAVAGGVFGLLGGYLTDRLGRRRVLTWSILLYAFSAFFAGFSTNIYMLLFFRCTCFIGVCVEFVAAVAWLAELFPNPVQREKVLGYTQAFSSIGGMMVAIANGIAIKYGANFFTIDIPDFLVGITGGDIAVENQHAAWRYTLMSGLIPAIPLMVLRPFLPESPVWQKKREAGTLKRPSIAALFAPDLRKATIVSAIGFACSLGIAFGAIQQMPQIVPGLKEVQAHAAEASTKAVAAAKKKAAEEGKEIPAEKLKAIGGAARGRTSQQYASEYTKMQEVGGLVGRFAMAMVLVMGVSWGWRLRMFQIPSLFLIPLLFYYFVRAENKTYFEIPLDSVFLGTIPVTTMSIGMFLMGFFVVSQLSFWGNYLPSAYPIHLRGTGESFSANIGGRLIGTMAAAVTSFLAGKFAFPAAGENQAVLAALQFSTAAAIVGTVIAMIGFINSFWLPEPKNDASHE